MIIDFFYSYKYFLNLIWIFNVRLAPDEVPASVPTPAPLLNIDMGELTYNPSYKDLADSEIHHILEDSMFKLPKRVRWKFCIKTAHIYI